MKENVVREKSYRFALRIVDAYKTLSSEKKEFVLAKQMLRSATAIGANVEEADAAISRAEFSAKISIAWSFPFQTDAEISLLPARRCSCVY